MRNIRFQRDKFLDAADPRDDFICKVLPYRIANSSVHPLNQQRQFLLTVCLCLQLTACGAFAKTSAEISQQTLVAQIESGTAPVILDVRTSEEYAAGHIPGAINIHFRDIEDRLDEIPQNGPIVVYCERGIRASIAERTLREAGIDSLIHLEGDIVLWRKNNLPLENDRGASLGSDLAAEATDLANSLEQRWIVSADEAKQLIDQGATLLDTRKYALTRPAGAIYTDWQQFSSQENAQRGTLLEETDLLTQRLQKIGVSHQTPVVVFADPPGGWGEDGRIVWMLRTLGHTQAVIVDGGVDALVEAGISLQLGTTQMPKQGDFVVDRNSSWEIQQDRLKARLGDKNLVVIDSRELREYAGQTPYGEKRGGHIPGAVHLYFKELLGEDGKLLPVDVIRAKLQAAGIMADTQVVVYCTGGIRSGWLAAILATLGYDVQNYAGSMWEWSAAPADSYPLELQ